MASNKANDQKRTNGTGKGVHESHLESVDVFIHNSVLLWCFNACGLVVYAFGSKEMTNNKLSTIVGVNDFDF